MKRIQPIIISIIALMGMAALMLCAQEPDASGCKDHPLFNRMPGYRIQRCDEKKFDSHTFVDGSRKEIAVEGRVFEIRYVLQEGATAPSRIQIIRNYQNAITKIGGAVLSTDDDGNSYLKAVKEGKEIWVHVNAYLPSEWMLTIVEKQAMEQEIVASAKVFAEDINTTGHAAVYGIYFDSGKSEIKAGSDKALGKIAKLLKNDPNLKLNVVGHTDSTGGMDANIKLSQARAEAVVNELVGKNGIAAGRLKGYGVGPLAPVATNDNEAGKAKNRRVELVKDK